MKTILAKDLPPTALRQIGALLSRAFLDDPMFLYLQPDPKQRLAFSAGWMTVFARYGMRFAQLYITPEPIRGVSIWMPPNAPAPSALAMIRCGILGALSGLHWRTLAEIIPFSGELENLRRKQPPHWYLWLLGVEPAAQGQGIGSALMEPGLQAANRGGLPCYLETMTERDVAFYQKRGFQTITECRLPNGAPCWTMLRPAVTSAAN